MNAQALLFLQMPSTPYMKMSEEPATGLDECTGTAAPSNFRYTLYENTGTVTIVLFSLHLFFKAAAKKTTCHFKSVLPPFCPHETTVRLSPKVSS